MAGPLSIKGKTEWEIEKARRDNFTLSLLSASTNIFEQPEKRRGADQWLWPRKREKPFRENRQKRCQGPQESLLGSTNPQRGNVQLWSLNPHERGNSERKATGKSKEEAKIVNLKGKLKEKL